MLLHRIDVVPANKATWSSDPLSGEIKDGYVYGRGALDTKSSGVLHLAAFVALHRSKMALNRDVIFMATADEEAGGFFGVGWLVKNRPELFKGVGYVINEGDGGQIQGGRTQFGIEVTQKVPYQRLHLTARGQPGHGSTPRPSSAVTTLISALERLRLHQFRASFLPWTPISRASHRSRHQPGANASRISQPRSARQVWWQISSATIRDGTRWSGTRVPSRASAAATRSMWCRRRPAGPRSTAVCYQIRTRNCFWPSSARCSAAASRSQPSWGSRRQCRRRRPSCTAC